MQNGKGDKPRPYDPNKYTNNYDDINWHRNDKNNCNTCIYFINNICCCIDAKFKDNICKSFERK